LILAAICFAAVGCVCWILWRLDRARLAGRPPDLGLFTLRDDSAGARAEVPPAAGGPRPPAAGAGAAIPSRKG
jgi:hypothetical protein